MHVMSAHVAKCIRLSFDEDLTDGRMQAGLIVFHRQNVIGLTVDDALGNRSLTVQGIGHDCAAFDIEFGQQYRNRRDFIGLLRHLHLTHHHLTGTGPDTDHMQNAVAHSTLVRTARTARTARTVRTARTARTVRTARTARLARAAQLLPIDANHLTLSHRQHALHPTDKTLLKGLSIQQAEYASKRVVRGYPIRQVQKRLQPGLIGFAIRFNVFPVIAHRNNSQDRDHDDAHQLVSASSQHARIRQVPEMRLQLLADFCSCHPPTLHSGAFALSIRQLV
jgi:hypothetical protein